MRNWSEASDRQNQTIEEHANRNFREQLEVENMLGKDDWHLCEGLLQIFLKGGSKQTIFF